MTFDQQEPSANSPCTKTTFSVFGDVWALATRLSNATAADADFENLMAVAFAVFSGIAGSKRIVFERGPSLLALQELHRELSLMCQSYLLASRRGRQGD